MSDDLDDNELINAKTPLYSSRPVVDDWCRRLATEVTRRRRRAEFLKDELEIKEALVEGLRSRAEDAEKLVEQLQARLAAFHSAEESAEAAGIALIASTPWPEGHNAVRGDHWTVEDASNGSLHVYLSSRVNRGVDGLTPDEAEKLALALIRAAARARKDDE